jgi:hypothetical protein
VRHRGPDAGSQDYELAESSHWTHWPNGCARASRRACSAHGRAVMRRAAGLRGCASAITCSLPDIREITAAVIDALPGEEET